MAKTKTQKMEGEDLMMFASWEVDEIMGQLYLDCDFLESVSDFTLFLSWLSIIVFKRFTCACCVRRRAPKYQTGQVQNGKKFHSCCSDWRKKDSKPA